MTVSTAFSSGDYWETRYRMGGTSGMGSVGRLARFKAGVINRFITENTIHSMIDIRPVAKVGSPASAVRCGLVHGVFCA